MVRGAYAVAVAAALLLVVPAMSGCIGSSSEATDDGDDQTSDTDTSDDTQDNQDNQDNQDTSPPPDDDSDGNESVEPDRETFTNSTTVLAGVGIVFYDVTPPETQTSWTVLGNPPDDFTGALVEFSWSNPTKGTEVGRLGTLVEAPDNSWNNFTETTGGPIRVHVDANNYTKGPLEAAVWPTGPVSIWANAEITVHTTYWTGGPPDWSFSDV